MAPEVSNRYAQGADETVVDALQQTLVEFIELALQGKQAHWNVVGTHFPTVHAQLDEVVEVARYASDEVAERLASIGAVPDGRLATVADARPLEPFPAGTIRTDAALEAIGSRLDDLTARLARRIADTAEADPISQGILIAAAQRLEKLGWMIRAQRA
jgi:starvation-inducible DNA-binding protein